MKRIALALLVTLLFSMMKAQPPRTGCFWEWMNGNISKEGITKDLEYMKAAGIESAFIFDVWVGVKRGPVDYGTKEWIEAVKFACSEAKRLGITLGIHNSPGYSAMGGPWITPEESMKQLTWSVSDKKNPPVPDHKYGFYKDIKTFTINSADEMQDVSVHLEKGESYVVKLVKKKPLIGLNLWRGERETPNDPFDGPRDYAPILKVETSIDQKEWKEIGKASGVALKARDIDRLHANTDSVRVLTDYIRKRIEIQKKRVEFDFFFGEEGSRSYIRLPRGCKEVKAILYCHQNMTEEVLFRSKLFTEKMDSMGIAMAFIQRGSQNWDVSVKDENGLTCQDRFENIIRRFAEGTEHPELTMAKIIPFGHSAQATFPWNFAAWNSERTLCIISYHGDAPRTNLCGYGRANVEWGRTRNIDKIPALMIEGEYEWWEARVNPALAFRMHYPDSRISFLCDAEKGHFDMSEETQAYMAKFIEKALHYTPVSTVSPDGDKQFIAEPLDGVYYSRWRADGKETDDIHDCFWYFDDEMVNLTKTRYRRSLGKKMQYVSAKINGKLVEYNPMNHVKINIKCDKNEFTLEPVYVDESRMNEVKEHAAAKPRIVLISGPAIQIGEYTFRIDPDYFGNDPLRQWSGITLCVEADGDDEYKAAVQEINVKR